MMNRRTFVLLAAGGLAASAVSGAKIFRLGTRLPEYRKPELDEESPTGKLSSIEMGTVMALAEILVHTEKKSERLYDVLRSHVDSRTLGDNGYFREYRKAVRYLDETTASVATAGAKFAELPVSQRQRMLEQILWEYRADQARIKQVEAIFSPARTLAFRNFVVKDILEAFFRKLPTEAWGIVGYSHYPGLPADPRAYTRPFRVASTSR